MIRRVGDSRRLGELLPWDDSGVMAPLPEGVPCVVGSPPYNVAIPNYPSGYPDHVPWGAYYAYARQWAKAIAAVLCPGGRAWVNVQPTVPRTVGEVGGDRINLALVWAKALEEAGLVYRDTVTWVQDSFDGACAWGSYAQPSNPNMRGGHELILVYYKERWDRPIPKEWKGAVAAKARQADEARLGGPWTDLVRNVWKINPANGPGSRAKDRPAAFPIDVPARCIRLSTWPGEWVADPWAGHCTTGQAADELGRPSVMVDLGFA